MDWAILPLRRYSDYSGRSRRKEFWLFQLLMLVVSTVAGMIDVALGVDRLVLDAMGPVAFLTFAALVTPSLAVSIRRLHDTGRSGWWMLLMLTLVGTIPLILFWVLDGERGANRYGADPKTEREAAAPAA